jgi:phospholipid/cholesterol/gamma-HCH transport system permease protein
LNHALALLEWFGHLTAFAARAVPATVGAAPRIGRWLRPLYAVLVGGLPLAVVTGLALGVVIWMHTRDALARTGTGAAEYLPTLLAAAVLLELAPVGAGLIVAARTGASLGAELSSMRVSEQIDALELLGVSPVRRLVGPRVVACVLAVPLLHALIAATALGSGFLAETLTGSTTFLKFSTAALRELLLEDVIPAGLKTLAFGLVVGVTGCYIGMYPRAGSEGVGRAATDSVVACSLLVLVADVMLVLAIKAGQTRRTPSTRRKTVGRRARAGKSPHGRVGPLRKRKWAGHRVQLRSEEGGAWATGGATRRPRPRSRSWATGS